MRGRTTWVVYVLSLCVFIGVDGQAPKYTTPYIEQVFKGKCLYKTSITTSTIVSTFANPQAYCNALWGRFNATAVLPANQQNNVTWSSFFELADFTSQLNSAMLWSGSYTFSQTLANEYSTLESTVTGYILDGLWWCPASATNSSEFDTSTPCAYYDDVPAGYYGLAPVWQEASNRFASSITGDVVVLLQSRLNTSDPYAAPVTFRSDSIFATIELPALNRSAITSLVALYMPGDRNYIGEENCNNGTLLNLKAAVLGHFAGYPTQYFCFDDNRLVMRLCTNRSSEEIQALENGISSLNALLAYADNFDFPTSQSYPECALGVLAYLAGVDDVYNVVLPTLSKELAIAIQLNATLTQLNNTQTQLQQAQQRIVELENAEISSSPSLVLGLGLGLGLGEYSILLLLLFLINIAV